MNVLLDNNFSRGLSWLCPVIAVAQETLKFCVAYYCEVSKNNHYSYRICITHEKYFFIPNSDFSQ